MFPDAGQVAETGTDTPMRLRISSASMIAADLSAFVRVAVPVTMCRLSRLTGCAIAGDRAPIVKNRHIQPNRILKTRWLNTYSVAPAMECLVYIVQRLHLLGGQWR